MGYGVAMTKRCYTHLSDAERETLSLGLGLGLAHGQSLRTMASVLGPPCRSGRGRLQSQACDGREAYLNPKTEMEIVREAEKDLSAFPEG